jgi:hypothetical protein
MVISLESVVSVVSIPGIHCGNDGSHLSPTGDSFEYNGPPNDLRDPVTVCHRTQCDNKPYVELEVPSSTLQAHLDANRQDFVGECLQNPDYVKRSFGYNNINRAKVEELFKQGKVCSSCFNLTSSIQSMTYILLQPMVATYHLQK